MAPLREVARKMSRPCMFYSGTPTGGLELAIVYGTSCKVTRDLRPGYDVIF